MQLAAGRLVQWTSQNAKMPGRRYGMVRRVTKRYVTVQLASNPDAASRSAQYRGRRVVVDRREIDGVWFRKRLHPVD